MDVTSARGFFMLVLILAGAMVLLGAIRPFLGSLGARAAA